MDEVEEIRRILAKASSANDNRRANASPSIININGPISVHVAGHLTGEASFRVCPGKQKNQRPKNCQTVRDVLDSLSPPGASRPQYLRVAIQLSEQDETTKKMGTDKPDV